MKRSNHTLRLTTGWVTTTVISPNSLPALPAATLPRKPTKPTRPPPTLLRPSWPQLTPSAWVLLWTSLSSTTRSSTLPTVPATWPSRLLMMLSLNWIPSRKNPTRTPPLSCSSWETTWHCGLLTCKKVNHQCKLLIFFFHCSHSHDITHRRWQGWRSKGWRGWGIQVERLYSGDEIIYTNPFQSFDIKEFHCCEKLVEITLLRVVDACNAGEDSICRCRFFETSFFVIYATCQVAFLPSNLLMNPDVEIFNATQHAMHAEQLANAAPEMSKEPSATSIKTERSSKETLNEQTEKEPAFASYRFAMSTFTLYETKTVSVCFPGIGLAGQFA